MRKLRLLVVGDLHWAALSTLFPNDWLAHTQAMLDQVCNYAEKRGIKTIVFTGDIFNKAEPSQEELLQFYLYFNEHKDKTFIMYSGNHDIKDAHTNSLQFLSGTSEYALPHCKFITQPTVLNIKGHDIVINPWPHTKLPTGAENAKLGFAHVIVANAKADNGRKFTSGEKLSKNLFWIIGDLHKHQKSKYWLFPGAPLQGNFQDKRQRYFFEVSLTNAVHIKRIKLHSSYELRTKIVKNPGAFEWLEKPNTFWRVFCNRDIDLPDAASIKLCLPRTKAAKQLTKDVNQGMDKVIAAAQIPTTLIYLKQMGISKPDRQRLMRKLESLK